MSKLAFSALLFFFALIGTNVYSQINPSAKIPKSTRIETIGGVKYYMHTVQKGQTLYAISKVYDRQLSDIVLENPDAIDGIKPDQVLKIPYNDPRDIVLTPIPVPLDTVNKKMHLVTPGQTLYSLSRQYNISIAELMQLNPVLKDGLKVGQNIIVGELPPPPPTLAPAPPKPPVKDPPKIDIKSIPVKKVEEPQKIVVEKVEIIKDTTYLTHRLGKKKIPVVTYDTIITTYDSIVSPKVVDDTDFPFPGAKSEHYNVAFFLPFHAEEADTMELEKILRGDYRLPYKSNFALQFYEGALMALDSLKKNGLNATVFVYDINDTDSLYIKKLLKKPELLQMDLMIGPLYGSDFLPISNFAKENEIPIVSPFTQQNKILFENPFVCKALPSGVLQVEELANYVINTYATQNIILVNTGNSREVALFDAFKNTAEELLVQKFDTLHKPLTITGGYGELKKRINPDTNVVNVVVLPTNSQSYVTEFLNELNTISSKRKIVLFGLQSWLSYDNLDFEYLNHYSLHVPSNRYIDYTRKNTRAFITEYREKYKAEPEIYGYSGFDVTYYFVSALQKYGKGFLNNIGSYKYTGLSSNTNYFQSVSSSSGFENNYVVILKYKDYKLIKAN